MKPQSGKQLALLAGKFLLLAAMLGCLFWTLQRSDEFWKLVDKFRHPEQVGWTLLIGGWLLFFLGILINVVRWKMLTQTLGLTLSMRDALRIGLISHFVSQMGFGLGLVGGDTVRAVFLTRTNPKRGPEATTAVVMDRAVGLVALLLLGGISSLFLDLSQLSNVAVEGTKETNPSYLVDIVWVVRGLAVATIIGGGISLIPGLTKWRLWDTVTHIPAIGKILQRLVNAIRVYHARLDRVFLGVLMSLVVQSLFVLSLHSITEGLRLDHPDLKTHFSIAPISFVAAALPIGAWEIVMEGMYRAIGKPLGVGLLAAVGYRLGTVVTALVGLVIYLATRAESAAMLHDVELEQQKAEQLGP